MQGLWRRKGASVQHGDRKEIVNSGGHAANTGNLCLGVRGITLSPSGDSYSNAFTIDVSDPRGKHVDHALIGPSVARFLS